MAELELVAYVLHEPQAVIVRDDGDEVIETERAGTALVVLFADRCGGGCDVEARTYCWCLELGPHVVGKEEGGEGDMAEAEEAA